MRPNNISNQRILAQVRKLTNQKLTYLQAGPLPDDIYTWHFTIQGPQNTQFHEGLYHGQILLPYEYPFKPPDIVFMNKNGRFQTNTKICLTITQYHPQQWNSAWTIRTMLQAVISLFAQNVQGVGSLASSSDVRIFLAKNSHSYVCQKCGPIKQLLLPRPPQQSINNRITQSSSSAVKVEDKIERKLSQATKPIDPPVFQRMVSDNIYTLHERKKHQEKKEYHHKPQSSTKAKKQQPIMEKQKQQNEDLHHQNYTYAQTVIVQDTNYEAEKQLSFIKQTKKIKYNMMMLDNVHKSIKWVD